MSCSRKAQLGLCLLFFGSYFAFPQAAPAPKRDTVLLSADGVPLPTVESLRATLSVRLQGAPIHDFQLDFAENEPLYIGLLIDESGSIRTSTSHSSLLRALLKALKPLVRPDKDRVFLARFNDEFEVAVDYTSDMHVIEGAALGFLPSGGSAVLDALKKGCDHFPVEARRRVLVVLSDGSDNASALSRDEGTRRILACATPVFAMMFKEDSRPSPNAKNIKLERIAERSGGRAFKPPKPEEIEADAAELARLLKNQYFLSCPELVGATRKLEVRVPKGVTVLAPAVVPR